MIIIGVRSTIIDLDVFLNRVAEIEKQHSVTVQFFRASRIFGAEHLISATEKALRAVENGTAMSKTLGMEIMLYAAAERQTSEALRKVGIHKGITEMAAAIVGEISAETLIKDLGLERDDSVLAPEGKDPSIFGITPEDISLAGEDMIPDLVLEKIAISEVTR